MITGQCDCGGVHFTIAQMRETVTYCHCSQCRKMSGHVLALTRAQSKDITFQSDDTLRWYRSSDEARRGVLWGLWINAVFPAHWGRSLRHCCRMP